MIFRRLFADDKRLFLENWRNEQKERRKKKKKRKFLTLPSTATTTTTTAIMYRLYIL